MDTFKKCTGESAHLWSYIYYNGLKDLFLDPVTIGKS